MNKKQLKKFIIEFPENEDIIEEYNSQYGIDYDKIEIEIN